MRRTVTAPPVLLLALVAGCGSNEAPQVMEQIVVREPGDPAVQEAGENAATRDLVALGEDGFQRCTGCHAYEAGAPSAAGPNLYGVIGREAGALADYLYSDALVEADFAWDEASLDAYLAAPAAFVPGTEMEAGAVPDANARRAIVAYLAAGAD
ncbi:c-type cytochrome [Erythrobacter sp.]|jgi:cytochrome c|uniref:c-type cytochrome n=1 Tax=Erythrobacter sp. TaxID=1042 RepID=UPI002EB764E0|nr:cytochrome c family protein [Erythrobacter sp.]